MKISCNGLTVGLMCIPFSLSYGMEEGARPPLTYAHSEQDLSHLTKRAPLSPSNRSNSARNLLKGVLVRCTSSLSIGTHSSESGGSVGSSSSKKSSDKDLWELQKDLFSYANYSSNSKEKALQELKKFRKQGVNINTVNDHGITPLRMAAKKGREGVVEALLEFVGPDDVRIGQSTALIDAASAGHALIVATLLDAGAKVEACNPEGKTALWCAALSGSIDTMRALLRAGADVHRKVNGQPLLTWAIRHGELECARELIKANARIEERDLQGKTALDYAIEAQKRVLNSYTDSVEKKDAYEEIVDLLKNPEKVRGAYKNLSCND